MAMLSQLVAERPVDLTAALALLAADDGGGPWRPLAGGTDLLVEAQHGKLAHKRFLDLSGLRGELGGLRWQDDGSFVIGALATYLDVQRDARCQAELPGVCAMSRLVGAVQIQARGTPAGNVENGSPAADVAPVLMALDTRVRLQSASGGQREVALADYYTGYRATVRRSDELIVALVVPPQPFGPGAQWTRKVGTRAWQAITKVGLAAHIGWQDGRIVQARLVAISMAASVCRLPTLEAALVGDDGLDAALWLRLRALQAAALVPLDDVRSTAAYRAEVFARLVRQAVNETRARAL
jgi:CO/xanthine dehydrogenase FAD-binding subunit